MSGIGDNGGPPLTDGDVPRMHFFKGYHAAFINGIMHMSLEMRGAYCTVLFIMYDRMAGFPYDEQEGAVLLRVDKRVYRRVRDYLIADGKFYRDGDVIRNKRVEDEITAYVTEYLRRSEAAKKREAARKFHRTSVELPANFARTSGELPAEVREKSDELETKNATKSKDEVSQRARILELELELELEKKKRSEERLSDSSNELSSPLFDEKGNPDDFDARSFNRQVVDQAFADYLALAKRVGLSQVRPQSLKHYREDMIRRMRDHADNPRDVGSMLEIWRKALRAIEISAFCQGENDRGWKADLTYLCQKKSFLKLITGGHGNGAHAPAQKPKYRNFNDPVPFDYEADARLREQALRETRERMEADRERMRRMAEEPI